MNVADSFRDIASRICESNGWEYVDEAGVGAFKHTFKVRDSNGKEIALKVYKKGDVTERTEREIAAIKDCKHRNLPAFLDIHQFSVEGDVVIFTTEEFLHGGSLTSKLQSSQFDRAAIKRLGADILAALQDISQRGLVHRDIKPDNIMFREDRATAVLVDFGLVRDLTAESLTASWLDRGPGTPLYASAEQLNNEKNMIDWRSDQFSLGIVLSYCAYGKHPYQVSDEDNHSIVQNVLRRTGPADHFKEWANANEYETIAKMVAPWPVSRFRTVKELISVWNEMPD